MEAALYALAGGLTSSGIEVSGGIEKMADKSGGLGTVSYTHLDVYKRQPLRGTNSSRSLQRSFASSPVSASTIRLRRSSLGLSLIHISARAGPGVWRGWFPESSRTGRAAGGR